MKRYPLLLAVLLSICSEISYAGPIYIDSWVGDLDGLGTGVEDGGSIPVPPVVFDNRSLQEAAAINGAQFTDISTTGGGITLDFVDFEHIFALDFGDRILGASLYFGLAGLEGNFQDNLLIDGTVIPNAFEALSQGGFDYDAAYKVDVPVNLLGVLLDGQATVRIDANIAGSVGCCSEPFFLDYSRLEIEVPVPATIALIFWGFVILSIGRTTAFSRMHGMA